MAHNSDSRLTRMMKFVTLSLSTRNHNFVPNVKSKTLLGSGSLSLVTVGIFDGGLVLEFVEEVGFLLVAVGFLLVGFVAATVGFLHVLSSQKITTNTFF